jgi:hypothetical protein
LAGFKEADRIESPVDRFGAEGLAKILKLFETVT